MRNIIWVGFLVLVGCAEEQVTFKSTSVIGRMQELIGKAPSYENYLNLGFELARQGRPAEAEVAYRQSIAINPNAPLAYNNLCVLMTSQKNRAEAIKNCKMALSLEPDFALAKNNLKNAEALARGLK